MTRSYLIKPFIDRRYPQVAHGQGVFLYDTEGRQYLDGCSGAVTANIGHGVTQIVEAMSAQAAQVAFSYRSQFTNGPAEELAAELARLAPGDLNWTFFVNSGSEALETALKIAVQYWQERGEDDRTWVLSRKMSYHGITLGALSLSGFHQRRRRFTPLLQESPVVVPPYCYRCPLGRTYPGCGVTCAEDLEAVVSRLGPQRVAAFVAEPMVGAAGGAFSGPPEYFGRIREICDRHGILFIADEVMTGMGRTGRLFAIEHWGVTPDVIALGKGLSAGYTPLAATLVSDRVMGVIRRGSGQVMSGHTFSANPLSCAVGLAVLRYVQEHGLAEHAAEMGGLMRKWLQALQRRHPILGDVRGAGLMWGLELVADPAGPTPFPPQRQVTSLLVESARRRGLLLYPALVGADAAGGDAVLVAPPLTITAAELDLLVHRLDAALADTALELVAADGRQR